MDLFNRDGFAASVGALPAVTFHEQWSSLVAKVGGRVFALLSEDAGGRAIVFKVAEETFEVLTALPEIGQAAYFAKRQWVAVAPSSPLGADDILAYIGRSHSTMVGKLTRKARAELGL